ncbi:hypothetical protein IJ670_05330 [bacterium]|nr:hypothetical protein [bacterium]
MFKKLFNFKDVDTHYNIVVFGIQFTIKHKSNFKYQEAKELGVKEVKRPVQLIVSLTSFPARINQVHLTLNTLLQQETKPDRVILWLSENQFPKKEQDLPENILRLTPLGLEVKWCKDDIRSYKKLIPALVEFPNDIIVTADDDMYYKSDWLKGLYDAYLKNPQNIYTRRGCRVYVENGEIKVIKPRKYHFNYNFPTDFNNLLMGGAGTLYPPHSLHKDILNLDKIKNLIPTHDDIYFWVMGLLNNKKVEVVGGFDYSFYYTPASDDNGLCSVNNSQSNIGMSSSDAFKVISKEYPEVVKLLEGKNG